MSRREELEQVRLVRLNALFERGQKADDGLCVECGIRAGQPALCDSCNARRLMLQERYPGVRKQRIFQQPEPRLKEWQPYRDDGD